MHCVVCNEFLSEFEATRRNANTGQFLDICNVCFAESGLKDIMPTRDRKDLVKESDFDLKTLGVEHDSLYNDYRDYDDDFGV